MIEADAHLGELAVLLTAQEHAAVRRIGYFAEQADFGKGTSSNYIQNMAKFKGQVKSLLNIDKIIEEDKVALRAYSFPDEKVPLPA